MPMPAPRPPAPNPSRCRTGPAASPSGEPGEEARSTTPPAVPNAGSSPLGIASCQATRAWRNPPVPPADLADRILAAARTAPHPPWPVSIGRIGWKVRAGPGVVAARILVAVVLRRSRCDTPQRRGRPANPPSIASLVPDRDLQAVSGPIGGSGERPALDRALAEAHVGDLGPGPLRLRTRGPDQSRPDGCHRPARRGRVRPPVGGTVRRAGIVPNWRSWASRYRSLRWTHSRRTPRPHPPALQQVGRSCRRRGPPPVRYGPARLRVLDRSRAGSGQRRRNSAFVEGDLIRWGSIRTDRRCVRRSPRPAALGS